MEGEITDSIRKAREFISVEIDENPNVPDFAPTSDQLVGDAIRRVVELVSHTWESMEIKVQM